MFSLVYGSIQLFRYRSGNFSKHFVSTEFTHLGKCVRDGLEQLYVSIVKFVFKTHTQSYSHTGGTGR